MKSDRQSELELQDVGRRRVVARFDAEHVSLDGGLSLVREVDQRLGILAAFAACFTDHRKQRLVEHSVQDLLSQRVYGLIAGYEDLKPLASPSTLNRVELTPKDATSASRYKKVVYDEASIEAFFVDAFLKQHPKAPDEIILDLDATDDPIHGHQEGRFFHGYYGNYCYLPLYIFCGSDLLVAKLRPSNIDGSAGAQEEVARVVGQLRKKWPNVKVVLRADSGFARDALMDWCESNSVDFVFGLAKNTRLVSMISTELQNAGQRSAASGQPEREFKELRYSTLNSWSRERRVVAKAEHIVEKPNPRFVVTTLSPEEHDAKRLYEVIYCARGDMENRIKEQQLALFADRTSAQTMRANQLRLWFASVAYVLMNALRRFGLSGTDLERAQCDTIRARLIKVGALVCVSVRRVLLRLSAAAPAQTLFGSVLANLQNRLPSTA